ncbi:UBX domain-containing protein 4-like isoform X1 [Megalops cyprinoides]|uniref:UBX domain-containing protein 4-like isoform X1 n=1 Tax=Megalops cyprinoides TaxID=118141 RepID=UPI0018645814|nr:UBX domain-containing protein 4-like isoform X1 [Megalops cyprinoides]
MLWFEGTIPAAIVSAKEQKAIFVVVITGDDEQSEQLMSSWEDDRVAETAGRCCVAIKIDTKSETCVQFSQIYPVVCVPSSFFIGENGIPLEVIAGSVSAEELVKRIIKAKQMHAQQMGVPDGGLGVAGTEAQIGASSTPPSTPEPAMPQVCLPPNGQPGLTLPPSTASSAAPKESLSTSVEEGGASGHVTPGEDRSVSSDDVSLTSQTDESLDAKVERLTKKLEQRQEQKKREEEESGVRKEVERRKLGKEMLHYKRKQEEERTKHMLEERNREKAEEKAARERVRQQIAMDRADRASRYGRSQEEVEAAKAAALESQRAEQAARKDTSPRERSAIARIQFRLPDGSSFTNQFPSEAKLQEAWQFAAQEVGNRYGHFALATMFPRREFTGEDLERTLLELELVPSASIVLLPQTGRPSNAVVQSSGGGGIWALLGSLFCPLLAVWRFISSFLFGSPPPVGTSPAVPPQRSGPTSSSSSEPKRESLRKRLPEKRPEDFKRDGKICRLRTQEDSEDDNNTWNGNSTQQM